MVKVLIAAGGTGGHIIPALAVGQQMSTMGAEVLYVGHRGGMEERIYTERHVQFRTIVAQKILRKLTTANLTLPLTLGRSMVESARIIKEFAPHMFYGAGGFVTGPVGLAAALRGVPVYLQEQNSYPGITNRLLSFFAKKVFLGYPGAQRYFRGRRCLVTGNPILLRDEQTLPFDTARYGLRPDALRLLVLGGSQGSQAINRALLPILNRLHDRGIDLLWQTGEGNIDSINKICKGRKGVFAFGFTNEIQTFYHAAHFVIARAGALTLAELEMAKIPSILVPLPTAANNHQYYNALEAVERGTAIMLEQKDLSPDRLLAEVVNLRQRYSEMKSRFGDSLHRQAAQKIATTLMNAERK